MRPSIHTLIIVLLCCHAGQTALGNEPVEPQPTAKSKEPADLFQLPERENDTSETRREFSLKSAIGDTGIKVGICVGVFLIAILIFSKQRASRPIPREAIEILGSVPLASRQQVQLIKFGQKLVLVESSANGLKPISEITDQAEVSRMLDMIRPRTQ